MSLPDRAEMEAETLVKVVLVLAVVWLVLEIVGEVLELFTRLLGPFRPLLGLLVVALIVLWLIDRI
jgi:hypothetical protein